MGDLAALRAGLAAAEERLRLLRPPGAADACVSGARAADLLLALSPGTMRASRDALRALAARCSLKVHVRRRETGSGPGRLVATDVYVSWLGHTRRRVGVRGRYRIWQADVRFAPPAAPPGGCAVVMDARDPPTDAGRAAAAWCQGALGDAHTPIGADAAGLCFVLCLTRLRWQHFVHDAHATFLTRYPACTAPKRNPASFVFSEPPECPSSTPKPP